MKKKIMVIALVLVVAMSGVFAANNYKGASANNTLGVGLNLGTNTGVGLKFGMGKFDVTADIGLDVFEIGKTVRLGGDVAAAYEVYDIQIKGKHHMPVTVGAGVNFEGAIGEETAFEIDVYAAPGIEYTIPTFPMNFYFRLPIGVGLNIDNGVKADFFIGGQIGALYVFDL